MAHATFHNQTWRNGTAVIYSCEQGYRLADNMANNRTCTLIDGYHVDWSREEVKCSPSKSKNMTNNN